MLFATMITTGINVQQNDNQMIDQMVAGPFSGYLTMANSWGGSNFNTFNQTESWNQIPFNTPFEKFYSNYFKLETATGGKGHYWAMAKLLRVNTMLRVTDCYGPIPTVKWPMAKRLLHTTVRKMYINTCLKIWIMQYRYWANL